MKHVLVIVMILIPSCIIAQESSHSAKTEFGLWSVSFAFGGTLEGPASDMEEAMINAGFDRRSPESFFGSGNEHPFSRVEELSWMVATKRRLRFPFSIGIEEALKPRQFYNRQFLISVSMMAVAPTFSN